MTERIRVLVVDDHPVVRQGLRAFLSTLAGMEIVGEAADGDEAVRKLRHLRPDVALLDLVMPGTDGLAVLEQAAALGLPTRLIVLTSFSDTDLVVPAVRAGAAGYLLKDAGPRALEEAIRAVHRGEALLHPGAAGAVMREVAQPPSTPAPDLTPREREVLALLAQGLTNRLIARELAVAEKTVKTHVSHVLAKLGVADRTQAALQAVREGLV
ncbi:MAG: response regulator transcription factor [Egibacteraceae bacterium]